MTDQRVIQAADGRLVMNSPQAEALHSSGAAVDGVTTLTMAEVVDQIEQLPELGVCDFCSDTPVVEDFAAEDFLTPVAGSIGKWGACAPCAALIHAEDKAGLSKRSVERFGEMHPTMPLAEVAVGIALAQEGFWKHWITEGRPS